MAYDGEETARVKYLAVPYTRGAGIEVALREVKGFPHWTGCYPSEVMKLDPESQDFVFSAYVLQFLPNWQDTLVEWWGVLKTGGHLVLYLPLEGEQAFSSSQVVLAMRRVALRSGYDIVEDEEWKGGVYLVFCKRSDGMQKGKRTRPLKTACIVRYGGFGDMLQTAAILPALKRQGFHVTLMTTPKGQDILRVDPHVDAWILQDKDQVPNGELAAYWRDWSTRFDRFVNLSESIEGTLLAIPGRVQHSWPADVRRKKMGVNYGEWTAELAQVPFKPEGRFYPTDAERAAARALAQGAPNILWALAGSSFHKVYPWQDAVIAKILLNYPEAHIYLVGDEACKILEVGWENEPRVHLLSGELSIRETLALAQAMDLVIGPETGVLNAVAYEDIGKVILLSHSSRTNLTLHWKHTQALVPPEQVRCYPCHRLHYTREFCAVHEETTTALCQAAIDPEDVFAGVEAALEREALGTH